MLLKNFEVKRLNLKVIVDLEIVKTMVSEANGEKYDFWSVTQKVFNIF